MDDFLWSINDTDVTGFDKLYGGVKKSLMKGLSISGKEGTYSVHNAGDDFSCITGYCVHHGESIQNTNAKTFKNFNEATILQISIHSIQQK